MVSAQFATKGMVFLILVLLGFSAHAQAPYEIATEMNGAGEWYYENAASGNLQYGYCYGNVGSAYYSLNTPYPYWAASWDGWGQVTVWLTWKGPGDYSDWDIVEVTKGSVNCWGKASIAPVPPSGIHHRARHHSEIQSPYYASDITQGTTIVAFDTGWYSYSFMAPPIQYSKPDAPEPSMKPHYKTKKLQAPTPILPDTPFWLSVAKGRIYGDSTTVSGVVAGGNQTDATFFFNHVASMVPRE